MLRILGCESVSHEVGGVMNDVSSIDEETLNNRSCNLIVGTVMHLHNLALGAPQ